jgi:hypothetical protein
VTTASTASYAQKVNRYIRGWARALAKLTITTVKQLWDRVPKETHQMLSVGTYGEATQVVIVPAKKTLNMMNTDDYQATAGPNHDQTLRTLDDPPEGKKLTFEFGTPIKLSDIDSKNISVQGDPAYQFIRRALLSSFFGLCSLR